MINRILKWFAPKNNYEGAKISRHRKTITSFASPNVLYANDGVSIRTQSRYLRANHDLAKGVINTFINRVVGAKGIGIEPQPQNQDGTINTEYAKQLADAFLVWCERPEVTKKFSFSTLVQLIVNNLITDGEVFIVFMLGDIRGYKHHTTVPFSLMALESDMVPADYTEEENNLINGVKHNDWGQPIIYYFYKKTFEQMSISSFSNDYKPYDASIVRHLALRDTFKQVRGVSRFATVLNRLKDISQYEDYERVAAKLAASLTGFVKRNNNPSPSVGYTGITEDGDRQLSFAPGMIIDNLGQGEEIGLIDTKRPNVNLLAYRQSQLRAVSSGVGASYSEVANEFEGSYSSRRQEAAVTEANYAILTEFLIDELIAPVWEMFVKMAHLSGSVVTPLEVANDKADNALYMTQAVPAIDPLKEANASVKLVESNLASPQEIIRKRGGIPSDVIKQAADFRKQQLENNLITPTNTQVTQSTNTLQSA